MMAIRGASPSMSIASYHQARYVGAELPGEARCRTGLGPAGRAPTGGTVGSAVCAAGGGVLRGREPPERGDLAGAGVVEGVR
ncbi:hypothetical protein GCM10018790_81370 [Kitasatospora xanthocidica]|nr:hypothetical protein GCM10018790_81370 [Kitasatospora xanthocidica]